MKELKMDDKLNMNTPAPLYVTLSLKGLPDTSPTSSLEMAFWLNLKDVSLQQIELKCYELESNIRTRISELFSNELQTASQSMNEVSPTESGPTSTDTSGPKAKSRKTGTTD